MIRKLFAVLLFSALIVTACSQVQEPAEVQKPEETVSPTAPIATETPAPTATLVPTPTISPTPNPSDIVATLHLAPGLTERFINHSKTPADDSVIAMIQAEEIFLIDGLLFDTVGSIDNSEGAPEGAPAYLLVREAPHENRIVGWYDISTNSVIEASTGYSLNVRSEPGIEIETGPNGEEFYTYGFAWYSKWNRILPEPIIELLDDFYSEGVEHVRTNLVEYQTVADPDYFGGDMELISWDENLPTYMEEWGSELAGAPFMILPDSGTVDVRDARFKAAIDQNSIEIDIESVESYVSSSYPQNSNYSTNQTEEAVLKKIITPFRNPHRFSDLQKLIILDVLLDDRGPLTISIDFGLQGGFFVPDSGEKVIKIAPSEIDLMFGYDGIYFSKLPHELAHSIEFRDTQFIAEKCLPNEDDIVETLKYIMEYMWWIQQYPGNAPYWDWEPINSGLTLGRLLDGTFPNFGC